MTVAPTAAVRTDTGGVRDHNEDAAAAGSTWWAVADGMGGHAGGAVASTVAIQALGQVLDTGAGPAEQRLEDAMTAASAAVRRRGSTDDELATMGTTLVAAVVEGETLVVANVGDSRAYLLLDGVLHRLTRDDNVAEEMHALGLIGDEQVADHPGQYQLTKAIAAYEQADPRPTLTRAPARGRLLLCSDGLTGELGDATIGTLLSTGTVEEAADALLDAALRAPARDNVTVVAVDLG